jgi:hypothetical protein
MTADQLDRARAELSNKVASTARASGDSVMLHLLAGAEEAAIRGENEIAGHLLMLAGFREAGRDWAVCETLASHMVGYGRLVHGRGAMAPRGGRG